MDNKMKINNDLHHVLRVYLPEECMDQRIEEIISYCRRTGCSEVWFFTTSYDQAPSFLKLDELVRYSELLRKAMDKLQQAGIEPMINVMQTLGHVYFPLELQKDFPFQRRVSSNGRISHEGACPLCSNLREWVSNSYRIYAELKPAVIWVDDDFRTVMQGLSCFCELHLRRISEVVGKNVSRIKMINALKENIWPPSDLRKYFYKVTTDGFCELAEIIRNAVHEISPDTRIGLMTAAPPMGEFGIDIARIAKTLAGKSKPLLRPQIPMYNEGLMREIPSALLATSQMRAIQPEETEYYPEVENYIYSGYSNSAQFSFIKVVSQILLGFDNLAINVFSQLPTPFKLLDQPFIEIMEQRRAFLNKLHQLIPEGRRPYGISLYCHSDSRLVHRVTENASENIADWIDFRTLANQLPNLGLPVSWGLHHPWVFLSGDDVLALNASELNSLLSLGVVMDIQAAEALNLRGAGARIGVKTGDAIDCDKIGYERYDSSLTSNRFLGQTNSLHAMSASGDWKYISGTNDNCVTASTIVDYQGREVAPALLLTENENKERFVVLACSGHSNRLLIENPMRAEQLRNAFAWCARKPLPMAIPETTPYLWPILNKTVDGQLVAGIINLSTDTYPEFSILWGYDIAPDRVQYLDYDGNFKDIKFNLSDIKPNMIRVKLVSPIKPMDLIVLLFQ